MELPFGLQCVRDMHQVPSSINWMRFPKHSSIPILLVCSASGNRLSEQIQAT
jgi:hypothetical protein